MPHDRFFSTDDLIEGELVTLTPEESSHLSVVMRRKVGDVVELCNGKGALATASVDKIDKKGAQLKILKAEKLQKPKRPIGLLIAYLPHKLLDLVIEKGCELGVTKFLLYSCEKSRSSLSPSHQKRLQKIAVASIKQSGRLFLPAIEDVGHLLKWDSLEGLTLFGTLDEAPSLYQVYSEPKPVTFLVGPPSGLTPKEEEHLISLNAKPVRLYEQTLRAETAAIAAAALLTAVG